MGHEGFYNTVVVAMGNVVSALFMYGLQAAWLCQRLIDQDYRQNHGSRLKPLADCKIISEPIEVVSEEASNHKWHASKCRKLEISKCQGESPKKHRETKRRRYGYRSRAGTSASEKRLNSSNPYLRGPSAFSTVEYVNRLGQNLVLRRAFSDINISSNCSEFRCFDNNQNYLSRGNIDETTVAVTDQEFLRLIFTKGYVT